MAIKRLNAEHYDPDNHMMYLIVFMKRLDDQWNVKIATKRDHAFPLKDRMWKQAPDVEGIFPTLDVAAKEAYNHMKKAYGIKAFVKGGYAVDFK